MHIYYTIKKYNIIHKPYIIIIGNNKNNNTFNLSRNFKRFF